MVLDDQVNRTEKAFLVKEWQSSFLEVRFTECSALTLKLRLVRPKELLSFILALYLCGYERDKLTQVSKPEVITNKWYQLAL